MDIVNKDAEVKEKEKEERQRAKEEAEAEAMKKYPDMKQAQDIFLLDSAMKGSTAITSEEISSLHESLLTQIKEGKQSGLYLYLCEKFGATYKEWQEDKVLSKELGEATLLTERSIETKLEEAIESGGETDVLDAMIEKCRFYAKVGEIDKAYGAMKDVYEKPKISSGKKLDITMDKIRLAMYFEEGDVVKEEMSLAKKLCEEGGDWDRRNRLKVYEALYLITARQLKEASVLLKDCISTFTCTELCDFQDFVFYTSLTNILYLPRQTIKKDIIEGADIVVILRECPDLNSLLVSLYECNYSTFFQSLLAIIPQMERNRYFKTHLHTLIREMRILVYTQYLESYKSVTMKSMADAFGISIDFLDEELSRFIASGRLTAKIDKVGGIVETSRADFKNGSYQRVVKDGDVLLNRLSKLSRLINQ